jgi:thioredoxin reductase (NADPH)
MFKNMETVVVGGGDAAFQEALELSQYASRVSLVLRGPASRARADLVERAAANPKLVQLFNTEVLEIIGEPGQGVNAIRIRTADGGETLHPCEGVFVFIGVEPNVGSAPEGVAKDTDGALVVSEHGETALKGIWAIGAARSGYGGMLTDAAEDARRAVATIISRRSPT